MWNFIKNKRSYKHHIWKTEGKMQSFKNCKAHCVKSPYQKGKKATVAGWSYWVIAGSVKSASWVKFKWSLVGKPETKNDADTI